MLRDQLYTYDTLEEFNATVHLKISLDKPLVLDPDRNNFLVRAHCEKCYFYPKVHFMKYILK